MSANAFASDWVTIERQTVLFRDPANQQRRFVPLRLDDAKIKESLKQFAYVDWRQKESHAYQQLVSACRPIPEPSHTLDATESLLAVQSTSLAADHVWAVAVASNANVAASTHVDCVARIWDVQSQSLLQTLTGHRRAVSAVAVSSTGDVVVTGSCDATLIVWDWKTGRKTTQMHGHNGWVLSAAIARSAHRIVSGSKDNTVRIWDLLSGQLYATLPGHIGDVCGVAVTDDAKRIVSASVDMTIRVWDGETNSCLHELRGHTGAVFGVAISSNGEVAVSASQDKTLKVWNLVAGRCVATLEGHTSPVYSVATTPDFRIVVSGSAAGIPGEKITPSQMWDNDVRVWDMTSGTCIGRLRGHSRGIFGLGLTGDGTRVVSGSFSDGLQLWDIADLLKEDIKTQGAKYTNAKVLLVGDSGVGKTGLAIRLTQEKFQATVSTDGHWATRLRLPHNSSTEDIDREIWLWDFAGQADYRLIHQLFMDETALAVLVFNPQSDNPFEGLGQWDRDLTRAARRKFRKLLVAGRCDRGGLVVTPEAIHKLVCERGFARYLETSALTGEGCEQLRDEIVRQIEWDAITWTASPLIFKLLKDEIVALRDQGVVLLRIGELKQQLEMRLLDGPHRTPANSATIGSKSTARVQDTTFTTDDLRAVVGLLAGPGIVWQLEFGDFVLLQPEQINAYAAAVIRSVRAHTDEYGSIAEEDVIAGRLNYKGMKRLPTHEERIVLRAMHQTFVDHGLCLRQHTDKGTHLVFPSIQGRELPDDPGHPPILVSYLFEGALSDIYATLVVRLYHTRAFENGQLWRYAADFRSPHGLRMGLIMQRRNEGAGAIHVYFEPAIDEEIKVTFIKYVHEHLLEKAQGVVRLRHFTCAACGHPVRDSELAKERLEQFGKAAEIRCQKCDRPFLLWDLIEQKFASDEFQRRVQELEQLAKARIDNESRELILVGHAFAISGEAGQIFRMYSNSDHGIDGEIEFKDNRGNASGKRLYLQLKSGDSYLYERKGDGAEIFQVKKARWVEYWQAQAYPVMLVIRTSDGEIRWMNVSEYLASQGQRGKAPTRQIVFDGQPFTALNVQRMRDRLIGAGERGKS
jgi:small GTP-binding protein